MMKGHKFSSTYSNNPKDNNDKPNEAPYMTQVNRIERISIRGRESVPRSRDFIPNTDQSRSQIYDLQLRSQSQAAQRITNEDSFTNIRKLQTSSWLFSNSREKNVQNSRNQQNIPFTLDRNRKNKSHFSMSKRNMHKRIGK